VASKLRSLAFVTLAAVVASACGARSSPPAASTTASTPPGSASSTAPPSSTEAQASCVDRVFDRLSPAQRVGQLFALGLANDELGSAELGAIDTDHVGSVWFTETTTAGASAVRAVADAVQTQATAASTGRVRFFVAANQEGGEIQALRGSGFSTITSAVEQGTLRPRRLRRDAEAWGTQLRAAGVNLDFAPVMDVVPAGTEEQNAPIGKLHREFGSDPAAVAAHGAAFIEGMTAAGIATTAKHFPGLGRVRGNTDTTSGVVDTVTTPDDPFLEPFRAAVSAGVPIVMVAEATYTRIDPDRLAVFSPTVMLLLRGEIGFEGVIASDDLGAAAAVSDVPAGERAIDFLSAGGDLIVSKTVDPTVAMVSAVLARASSDHRFGRRVDDAVRKILAAKDEAGLLPCSGR
jgi:beta-N-acetylhexosaminidase